MPRCAHDASPGTGPVAQHSYAGSDRVRAIWGWFLDVLGRREHPVYCRRCGRCVHAFSEREYAGYLAAFAAANRSVHEALARGELDDGRLTVP